jgi:hypothetical protein
MDWRPHHCVDEQGVDHKRLAATGLTLGAARRCKHGRSVNRTTYTLKLSPQPHSPLAFGLLNWKLVEAFLHEVQLGAIQVDQALGIHDDLDAFCSNT